MRESQDTSEGEGYEESGFGGGIEPDIAERWADHHAVRDGVVCGLRRLPYGREDQRPSQRNAFFLILMEDRDLLLLESAMQAIDEAMAAVVSEVERDRLDETTLARLSSVEAELKRSRTTLEKVIRDHG